MKRKTIIQLTAALAAVGLVMIGVDRNTSKVAFAAFEGVEGSSEFIDTAEYAEEKAAAPVVLETENVISSEEMEAPLEEKTTVPGTENIPEESREQTETAQTTETLMPETVETSAETIPETFSEAESSESSSAREEETEPSSTESALESAEQTTESQSETEEERQMLTMVKLNIDQDLETVPVAFLPYLDELNVDGYSLTLVYSDNTEKMLDKADTRYTWSIEHEDETKEEGIITRTYRVRVTELSTGNTYEATQSVDFGKEEPVSIKTEEMTTVIVEGNKWVMVQSTPSITGIYSMNSSKLIDCIYYASDNESVVCADDTFKLEEGVTYQFLIKLK